LPLDTTLGALEGSFFFAAAGIESPAAKAMAVVAIKALLSLVM